MQLATTHKPRTSALSVETLDMLQQRRELKRDANVRNSIEFAELCKTIRKAVQHDLQQHHLQLIDEAIRTGTLRRARSGLAEGRRQITTLGRNDGTRAFMTAEIMDIVRDFYESLYRSSQQNNSSDADDDDASNLENDNALPFLESEICQALQKMKSGTSPGYDGITAEALSAGAESLAPILTRLFNNCLDHASIPEGFADAKTILLYKKGDATDIKNYRPISLLNTTYKVFTKVIGNRINSILDAAETAEQAGFQQSFSTINHIHAVNELIEKSTEYILPLFMVFVDYEKAFDSVENTSIWQALKRQNVPTNIITILKSIYWTSKSTIHIGDAISQR
uniref:Reverse transcriptase domain-containing protein n=1 Tax=Plectus sambesii TaxID=2011161 RepID=A0A914VP75_9BILA